MADKPTYEDLEKALYESEKKFRDFYENSVMGLFQTDKAGRPIMLNQKCAEIFGYKSPKQALEAVRNISDVYVRPEERLQFIMDIKKNGFIRDVEIECKKSNGDLFWININAVRTVEKDGSIFFNGILVDITDRMKVEESLKKSEEKYRLICNKIPIGIFHYDEHGVITLCNEQSAKIAGSSIETLMGFNLLKNVKNEHMLTAIKKSLSGKTSHLEGKYLSVTGGKTTYTKTDFVPLFYEGEKPTGGICVVEDVTGKIMAQKALADSKHQLQSIIDNASAVIWLKDKQGKYILINRQFETLFHITQEEIVGQTDYDVFSKEISDRLRENDLKVFNAGVPLEFEERIPHDDGVHTYISIKFPLRNASGTINCVGGISSDISGRKKMAEALEKSHENLRNLSAHLQSVREKERTRVAREVHDELGQALTAIKLDISWLKEKLSKNQKTVVKKAEKTIALVDTAIKSVQRIISELRPGLLNDLGLVAATEWQIKEFETRTGIKVDMTVDPEEFELSDTLSTTMFRIFQETLTNIARHSQATYMTVSLKEKDGILELIVRDNGIGITKAQIGRSDSFGLLGMMERAHTVGGEIKISGSPGKGTKVAVCVPIPPANA